MVARGDSMFGCYDSYSYRLWSLANVWTTYQFPNLTNGVLKTEAEEIGGQALLKSKEAEESVAPSPAGQEYFIKCPQCQKGCQSFQTLKEHMEQVHPEGAAGGVGGEWKGAVLQTPSAASPIPGLVGPGGPYGCSQCSTSFASKDQLEKHELLHSPNAQVSCKVCNKTFANVYRLQRHMISHDESAVLRKFKCTECEKAFKFKHHLKEHIRIHSGEKPFECGNCGKRFSHSGSYSSHMTSKKCLVMNLKLGRTRAPPGANSLVKKERPPTNSLNNNVSTSPNHNTYLPILPKYSEAAAAFLQHPFYMPAGPTIAPYSMPSLGHILEQLQGTSPHRSQFLESAVSEGKFGQEKYPNHEEEEYRPRSASPGELVMDADTDQEGEERSLGKDEEPNGTDLEAVKRILETVNASVTKQFLQANMQKYSEAASPRNSEYSCKNCSLIFSTETGLEDHDCEVKSEGLAAKLEDAVNIKTEDPQTDGYSCGEEDTDNDKYADLDCESVTTTDQVSEDGRKVRVRSLIADKQLKVLKDCYALNPRPKREELVKIANQIGFPVRVVQVWFQNTRARDRREGRLVQIPYSPQLRLPPNMVPSGSHRIPYPAESSPISEQPLDLSIKRESSPSSPFSNHHSDSGEEVVNLSYKSSRSPTPYRTSYQHSNSSSEPRHSPSPIDFNNGSKLASILAQPSRALSLVPMEGLMRLPTLSQIINHRIAGLSPKSEKRSWHEDSDSLMSQDGGSDDAKRSRMSHMAIKGLGSPGFASGEAEMEGQFICDQCDKAFSKQSSLARHKYEHSGQRPHKCDECTKAFKHKHHLTEHKRLHSGEKPFQCCKCLKRFSHSGSYSQHMNHRYSYCKPYRE